MADLGNGPGPVDFAVILHGQTHAPESQNGQRFHNLWHFPVKHEIISLSINLDRSIVGLGVK
jgi:hypothetical protein